MSKPAKPSKPPPESDAEAKAIVGLRYEEAMEELEAIVERVEEGQLPLEDGIKAHRRAILLLRHCEGLLDAAQAKVEEISGGDLAAGLQPGE